MLILFGGDVLFLETVKTISLYDEKVQEDISNLSSDAIIEKYGLPANVEIVQDLKEGLKTGKYPLINQNPEDAVAEFKSMIFEYIHRISLLKDPIEKKRQFEEIRRECERQILKINRG